MTIVSLVFVGAFLSSTLANPEYSIVKKPGIYTPSKHIAHVDKIPNPIDCDEGNAYRDYPVIPEKYKRPIALNHRLVEDNDPNAPVTLKKRGLTGGLEKDYDVKPAPVYKHEISKRVDYDHKEKHGSSYESKPSKHSREYEREVIVKKPASHRRHSHEYIEHKPQHHKYVERVEHKPRHHKYVEHVEHKPRHHKYVEHVEHKPHHHKYVEHVEHKPRHHKYVERVEHKPRHHKYVDHVEHKPHRERHGHKHSVDVYRPKKDSHRVVKHRVHRASPHYGSNKRVSKHKKHTPRHRRSHGKYGKGGKKPHRSYKPASKTANTVVFYNNSSVVKTSATTTATTTDITSTTDVTSTTDITSTTDVAPTVDATSTTETTSTESTTTPVTVKKNGYRAHTRTVRKYVRPVRYVRQKSEARYIGAENKYSSSSSESPSPTAESSTEASTTADSTATTDSATTSETASVFGAAFLEPVRKSASRPPLTHIPVRAPVAFNVPVVNKPHLVIKPSVAKSTHTETKTKFKAISVTTTKVVNETKKLVSTSTVEVPNFAVPTIAALKPADNLRKTPIATTFIPLKPAGPVTAAPLPQKAIGALPPHLQKEARKPNKTVKQAPVFFTSPPPDVVVNPIEKNIMEEIFGGNDKPKGKDVIGPIPELFL